MKRLLFLIMAATMIFPAAVHSNPDDAERQRQIGQAELDRMRQQARGLKQLYARIAHRHVMEYWNVKVGDEYPADLLTVVAVKIRPDGVVVGRQIEKLSPNKAFNLHVFKTISKAAPFPPFPDDLNFEHMEFEFSFRPSNVRL